MLSCPDLPNVADRVNHLQRNSMTLTHGRVASVMGDTIQIEGMSVPLGSVLLIGEENSITHPTSLGRVIGFEGTRPVVAPMKPLHSVSVGTPVRLIDHDLRIGVGDGLLGRVIDAYGSPIDGLPESESLTKVPLQTDGVSSLNRPPIRDRFDTGVKVIDTMLTCGQGQRLGIFAGSGVGKSTLLGMLARNCAADVIVVGMVGERGREVQEFLERTIDESTRAKTITVVATSDESAAARVTAPSTATRVAEYYRDRGKSVLLLVDSVTRFAMAQRELGLAAGEPPTTRGYPPSVFSQLPRLVERAGTTQNGSITAFYTVLVDGDDPNEPIADALRGLLDGHIMLSRKIASTGQYPPIDVPQSLSRLQPHLITKPQQVVCIDVRRLMADYRDNEDLIRIGAYRMGSDPRVDSAITAEPGLRTLFAQSMDEKVNRTQAEGRLAEVVATSRVAPNPNANPAPTPTNDNPA
ncbi:MAG: FliI/YscN family ATPase [Planctomycetota bacterium]